MRRGAVLSLVIGVGTFSIAVAGQQGQDANAARVVESDRIKDNLYVLRGGGGNSAAFITASGVVLVDTKNAGWGQPLIAKIRTITDKPITTIINTHSHYDHVSGNVEFPATIDIVAHENSKAEMEAWRPVTGSTTVFPDVFNENDGKGLPDRTFKDRLSIGSGSDRVDLYYFGRGHTGGDAWVVFPSLRTVHAGDMFANKNLPLIDANNGGSGIEYPRTLEKAVAGIRNVDTVINGHAPATMTFDDLRQFVDFNKDFAAWAQNQMKAGKTVEQAAAEYTKHPDRYPGYNAPQAARLRANLQIYYDELREEQRR
jgi:glyoxylase-like metal-dependent hydrolase (beta-lactamase superfamily II)